MKKNHNHLKFAKILRAYFEGKNEFVKGLHLKLDTKEILLECPIESAKELSESIKNGAGVEHLKKLLTQYKYCEYSFHYAQMKIDRKENKKTTSELRDEIRDKLKDFKMRSLEDEIGNSNFAYSYGTSESY